LVLAAEAEWFSSHEVEWINRLDRELPNVREALEFALSEEGETALEIAAVLSPFWITRGLLSEGRRWLDRAMAGATREPTAKGAKALYAATMMAGLQGDLPGATSGVAEGRALIEQIADPSAHALIAVADGFTALLGGDLDRAHACLDDAVGSGGELIAQAGALILLGWAHELRGDTAGALFWYQKVRALTESRGESVYRMYALWSIGIARWRHGDREDAAQLLKEGLRLAHLVNDPRTAATCLEALAWIGCQEDDPRLAAVLMGAAEALGRSVGSPAVTFPDLLVHHDDCELRARQALGAEAFEAAHQEGGSLSFDAAVAYALEDSTSR
jgi:non-specific serine/threonine protein kinase